LAKNHPSGRKKRPTPRYKSPRAAAIARTRRAKRLGLIAADCTPSRMPTVRRAYTKSWRERHPTYEVMYNLWRRQRRRDARALRSAPINSPEFIAAALRHVDCPKDPKDQNFFVFMKMLERGVPPVEPSPPYRQPPDRSGEFELNSSVTPSRPRRRRAPNPPQFIFAAT
jgi:hypothetical protein